MTSRWIVFLCAAGASWGYVARDPASNLHRTDSSNIQFLVNQRVAPGLQRADGTAWITGDSDPGGGIAAALKTWSGVATSAVRFAAPGSTSALNDAADRQNVIVFGDTDAIRSVLGDAVATTLISYSVPDGAILDTDIIFNPKYTFSTTLADDTLDLQAFLTHELGHALGAGHTNVLGAAMFQSAPACENRQASLSADDVAFVSAVYPAPGGNGYATVAGRATLHGGSTPIRGGMVNLVSPANGVTVSGMTSLTDGSFRFQAPAGDYLVYVEPLGGYVFPGNLYLSDTAVDTNFQSYFYGGAANPTTLTLTAGPDVNVGTLEAPAGSAVPRTALFIGAGQAETSQGAHFYQGPFDVTSGQSVDLVIAGAGIDPLTEQDLKFLGAGITLRAGSLHKTSSELTTNLGAFPIYRMTVDIATVSHCTLASIVIQEALGTVTLTGAISVGPPQVVNVGSYSGGKVSPGEVVAFFGSRVGPSTPVSGQFTSAGVLSSSVGDVSITFDGIPAPLFYVSQNQVNVQVPYEVAAKQSTTMVATYAGQRRGVFTIPITATHPGICAVTNADLSLPGPQSPASVGGTVVIWGTGIGNANGSARTGVPSPVNATVQATVTIGGITVTPDYAGLTPSGVGLMQVNFRIPAGVPPGDSVPLKVRIGEAESQTVNLSIR